MNTTLTRHSDGTDPPVAASHTRTTQWALGYIPTVRIGVGAGPRGQALVTAVTPVGNSLLTLLGKIPPLCEERKKCLEEENRTGHSRQSRLADSSFVQPLPRVTPLRIRCAPRVERLTRKSSFKSAQPY